MGRARSVEWSRRQFVTGAAALASGVAGLASRESQGTAMRDVLRRGAAVLVALAVLAWPALGLAHGAKTDGRLRKIGPAPEFTLTTQDGARLSLADLRGKVVAVTFIDASCTDTCPVLTAKMARIQGRLGPEFGRRVSFASITVDPDKDTPEVLQRYAAGHGANPAGWAFLTGTRDEIRDVARRYGIYYRKQAAGGVDHTFLTSLVDPAGVLRVQYLGDRFDPEEMLRDIRRILREASPR